MTYRRRQRRDSTYYLPATKLAAMGHCETKIVLEARYGDRSTEKQAKAREQGVLVHERFDKVVRMAHNRPQHQARDKRCFIASCVYGVEDVRTEELREFRDDVLARVRTGRGFIAAYYAVSPWVVKVLECCPALQPVVRRCVDRIRWWINRR